MKSHKNVQKVQPTFKKGNVWEVTLPNNSVVNQFTFGNTVVGSLHNLCKMWNISLPQIAFSRILSGKHGYIPNVISIKKIA